MPARGARLPSCREYSRRGPRPVQWRGTSNCTRCSLITLNLYLSPAITHRSEAMSGVVIAYAVVSVIWGSTYFGIRIALESFPPFLLGVVRFLPAGLLLLAIGRARGLRCPTRREWGAAAVTGALFFVV